MAWRCRPKVRTFTKAKRIGDAKRYGAVAAVAWLCETLYKYGLRDCYRACTNHVHLSIDNKN